MLRLERIFCSFPRKSQDYLSYCGGLATAGSSIQNQVEWIHQSDTRCHFAGPKIPPPPPLSAWVFLRSGPFCSISAQCGISLVIFCQRWSQFVVSYFNFPSLIVEQITMYWMSHGLGVQGCSCWYYIVQKLQIDSALPTFRSGSSYCVFNDEAGRT